MAQMDNNPLRMGVLTDSHVGQRQDGGWNQPVWTGGEEVLFDRLSRWRSENQVDFIVHCGDIAEPHAIEKGMKLLDSLGCPVLAVRGNHDIMKPVHYNDWQEYSDGRDSVIFGDAIYENEQCDVLLLNNQWFDRFGMPEWHWETSPVGWLNDEQLTWLDTTLGARQDRPAVVVFHYPLEIMPPYPVPKSFMEKMFDHSRRVNAVLDKHPRVKVVASGHFHRTTTSIISGRVHLTTAAFSEAPFQVRLLQISGDRLNVRTDQLWLPGDPVEPDPAKEWMTGEEQERDFEF